jgi:hypothetical protein
LCGELSLDAPDKWSPQRWAVILPRPIVRSEMCDRRTEEFGEGVTLKVMLPRGVLSRSTFQLLVREAHLIVKSEEMAGRVTGFELLSVRIPILLGTWSPVYVSVTNNLAGGRVVREVCVLCGKKIIWKRCYTMYLRRGVAGRHDGRLEKLWRKIVVHRKERGVVR